MNRLKADQTPAEAHAEFMVEGLGLNVMAAVEYASKTLGTLDVTECMAALDRQCEKVQDGNLEGLEALLAAQAVTLNAMFGHMSRLVLNQSLAGTMDRIGRLALKAQGQCRATVETLALIKHGPRTAVFAKQANIANGPQQVNNSAGGESEARARTRELETRPIGLLEAAAHGERLDVGAQAPTVAEHSALAPVGTLDGAAHGRG